MSVIFLNIARHVWLSVPSGLDRRSLRELGAASSGAPVNLLSRSQVRRAVTRTRPST